MPGDEILELDLAEKLPAQNRRSYFALMAVQALNAFNDNLVKILLVAFAGVVAKGTDLGSSMQLYLGAIFSLPYVLFAPTSGWLSDRFSKRTVIIWMQVAQVLIFGLFLLAVMVGQAQTTLWLSLGCFFLLATQAAFFSPARLGIAKEIVGSRRLGSASGMLQLTQFMGILGGMGLAGYWFGVLLKNGNTPWHAVWVPLVVITLLAVLQIFGALLIHRTPAHEQLKFYPSLMWEHFAHLQLLFSQRPIKLAALGIAYFWFFSNAVGGILVTLSHEMYPTDVVASSNALSMMPAMLGIGIMLGSLIAGVICRKRIELGIVPVSGFLLAFTVLWSGLAPVPPSIYLALIGVGLAGGVFMTPLYAFVQDRARPDERARIMSAVNLIDCVAAIIANIVVVKAMLSMKLSSGTQLLVLVPITLAAAIYMTRLLPRPLLYLMAKAVVRFFYRIEVRHEERVPREGALLVLPNHVSYVDVLNLGASCERDIRFVMLEKLYALKWLQWWVKIFHTVPISPTKAKEAVRTVATALKEGSAVCLFPEGQITRTGFLNEINRGYELMARMGGEVQVLPVWVDGLWGSIFSFERGRFFKKSPKGFPYKLSVNFGEPIHAKEATPAKLREALMELSAEAFAARPALKKRLKLHLPEPEARMAQINALRVLDTILLNPGDTVLCLLPKEHPVAQTFTLALPAMMNLHICWRKDEVGYTQGQKVVVLGGREAIPFIGEAPHDWHVCVLEKSQLGLATSVIGANSGVALYDADTGALLTLSVPDPDMPKGEEGNQVGHKLETGGHLLPGISAHATEAGLLLGGILAEPGGSLTLAGAQLDQEGFVISHI